MKKLFLSVIVMLWLLPAGMLFAQSGSYDPHQAFDPLFDAQLVPHDGGLQRTEKCLDG